MVQLGKFIALVCLAGIFILGACEPDQEAFFLVNHQRVNRGIEPLGWNQELDSLAQQCSNKLASTNDLAHTEFFERSNFRYAGENIGMGGSVWNIHYAMVASGGHLRNMIDPRFKYVGVGVSEGFNLTWVCYVFGG